MRTQTNSGHIYHEVNHMHMQLMPYPRSAVCINFLFAVVSQVGERGDAQAGAEAESQGV